MKRALLAVVASFGCCSCGCEPERSNDFLVDTKFSDYELSIIEHVADEFATAFGSPDAEMAFEKTLFVPSFSYDDWDAFDGEHAKFFKLSLYEPGYAELADETEMDFTGLARYGKAVALVWEPYTQEHDGLPYYAIMEQIVMHELGHHLGLHHGQGRFMEKHVQSTNAGPNVKYPCIDQVAVDVFCLQHECVDPKPSCKGEESL